MAVYRTEAIVLKRLDFEEASKIITLYTKSKGKVKAIAKGIRKLNSRSSGALEQFNYVRLGLAEGRNFDIIGEVETIQSFYEISQSLAEVAGAYCLCEMVDQATLENQKSPEIFDLLLGGLRAVRTRQIKLIFLRAHFKLGLLRLLGYWPEAGMIKDPKVRFLVDRLLSSHLTDELNWPDLDRQTWQKFSLLLEEYGRNIFVAPLKTDQILLDCLKKDMIG